MKILIVGSWLYPMYEAAFADALNCLGNEVIKFSWSPYFESVMGRAEEKFAFTGHRTIRFNNDLLRTVRNICPHIVLTWRGTKIFSSTLRKIKASGVKYLVSYNHDDFTGPSVGAPVPLHHHLHWRLFLKGAKFYDRHFVKRPSNIDHLETLGSQNNHIMPMWFLPELHHPVTLDENEMQQYGSDVVFVGHYEPDDRVRHLSALIQSGIKVRLFGGGYWTEKVLGEYYPYFAPIKPAEGKDYAKALCGSKVCLAFLSKLNRDTYTRRCFEIPACGRVMLAERTDDLMLKFREDKEACFFASSKELIQKTQWLMANPKIADDIANAGMRRVWKDGYDVNSAVSWFLKMITLQEQTNPSITGAHTFSGRTPIKN